MIRLKVGEGMVKRVVLSEFSASSTAATVMHIALTAPLERYETGLGAVLVIKADPEPWDALRRWCELQGRCDVGDVKTVRARAAAYKRLARKISTELTRLAQHPAYRGKTIVGEDPTVYPARRFGDGRWWPTIAQATLDGDGELEVVELVPAVIRRQGQNFTRWVPT